MTDELARLKVELEGVKQPPGDKVAGLRSSG